jgi:hypothetical protein
MCSAKQGRGMGKVQRSFSRKERGFQDDKGLRGRVETEPMLEDSGKKPKRGTALGLTNDFWLFANSDSHF